MYQSKRNKMYMSKETKNADKPEMISIFNPGLNAFQEVPVETAKKFLEVAEELKAKIGNEEKPDSKKND